MTNGPVYDRIAAQYQQSKQLPFRIHVEEHSLFTLLGDLRGKTVLDLACGEGIYTRKMKQRGASHVLGVDISPRMIDLAESQEREQTMGCKFILSDVASLGKLDEFDVVVGVYLLNYAKSADELARFCEAIARNLRAGGCFVGINDNPANPVDCYAAYAKYGFWKTTVPARTEGAPITYHMKNPDGTEFCFDNYYLAPATHEAVFKKTGFAGLAWCGPWLSAEGKQGFEAGYWDVFLDYPPIIGVRANR